MKLSMLAEDPTLMTMFNQLVLGGEAPKTWQESEFWEVYKNMGAAIQTDIQSESSQRRGIQNKPFQLARNRNPATQKWEYALNAEDCRRLLIEYPDLEEAYDHQVSVADDECQEQNQRFWTEFLQKNLEYQTIPFGGNNPVYVPGLTDEKDYEDTYIHNQ